MGADYWSVDLVGPLVGGGVGVGMGVVGISSATDHHSLCCIQVTGIRCVKSVERTVELGVVKCDSTPSGQSSSSRRQEPTTCKQKHDVSGCGLVWDMIFN